MRLYYLFLLCFISWKGFSQQDARVLATINKIPITVSEFKHVYEKNLEIITDDEGKDLENTLQLYIDFRLKVQQAYALKLDTLPSIVREINSYKNQLAKPYLRDSTYLDTLLQEAYFRLKNEINAQHILVSLPKDYTAKDTLAAYTKIMKARADILAGQSFESVAKKISEDPSVINNGGNLGFFGAFKMVYPFEDAAYQTAVGKISMPFRTQFGYHIVKNLGYRPSKGERTVAHLFLSDTLSTGKQKIDSIYQQLQNGVSFVTLVMRHSNDFNTKQTGGVLPKFGTGRMVKSFEDASFALTKPGSYSAPVRTRYGWHIIQLKEIHPVGTFEEMKPSLLTMIQGSNRMDLSDKAMATKLKKQYSIKPTPEVDKALNSKQYYLTPADSLQGVFFTINEKPVYAKSFANFLKYRRSQSVVDVYNEFLNKEILEYYKSQLIKTSPQYARDVKEFSEGVLLFELLKKKIWDKATKDSIGLQNYYTSHISLFEGKPLQDIKGKVMSEYQAELEKQWVRDLRSHAEIKIYKSPLKKLIKLYRKEE